MITNFGYVSHYWVLNQKAFFGARTVIFLGKSIQDRIKVNYTLVLLPGSDWPTREPVKPPVGPDLSSTVSIFLAWSTLGFNIRAAAGPSLSLGHAHAFSSCRERKLACEITAAVPRYPVPIAWGHQRHASTIWYVMGPAVFCFCAVICALQGGSLQKCLQYERHR